jgi:hypothetical protein
LLGCQIETAGKAAPVPYSAFLDQLEAGNIASVTFQGTEIQGQFKKSTDGTQLIPSAPECPTSATSADTGVA